MQNKELIHKFVEDLGEIEKRLVSMKATSTAQLCEQAHLRGLVKGIRITYTLMEKLFLDALTDEQTAVARKEGLLP